ncbi:serine-threonine kinase receptor-associated protein [Drosophila rhopaloa]|uniref:Serine-threonine kinase receptor-associated protein n=1 Tax=Drosophila rhopaloa TaxID=1041015 RepID=A0A6P4EBE9_DRORH|nr:serine-threonine kinase receptor-associated protein [Drosophila rhopaloa]
MMDQETCIYCEGHTDAVVDLSFSKDLGSGFCMASAGLDGLVMLRHGDTGKGIGSLRKHREAVWSVSLSEDGKMLASGGGDCTARVWDAILGRHLSKFRHPETVACLELDSRGHRLVTGCLGLEPVINLFDLQSLDKTPLMSFRGHHRGVRDLTFCLEERCVLTSSYDRHVKLWDCLSGHRTHSIVLPHHVKSMELHQGGEIVTISYGNSLIFLDSKQFEVLKHLKMDYKVTAATLSPNKEIYICGSNKGSVYKYKYATDIIVESYFLVEGIEVCSLKFSAAGEVCAIGAMDGTTILWRQNKDRKYGLWNTLTSSDEDDEDDSIS